MNTKMLIVVGFAIVAVFLIVFLRQHKPEYSLLVGIAASAMLLIYLLGDIVKIIGEIRNLFAQVDLSVEYIGLIFKVLGICYIAQFAAELCADFGQSSLAGKIELAGKISILILSLPIIKQIISLTMQLIQG